MRMIERLQRRREDGGFTLIELLIVIIILGILAAIVVFAVGSTRKDSVSSSCKTDFKSVELSAEAVNTKMGTYAAAAGFNGGDNLIAGAVTPSNGALLKVYPKGTDYAIKYVGGTSGTIEVHKAASDGSAT